MHPCMHAQHKRTHACTQTRTHTHTHTYIYIYIFYFFFIFSETEFKLESKTQLISSEYDKGTTGDELEMPTEIRNSTYIGNEQIQ